MEGNSAFSGFRSATKINTRLWFLKVTLLDFRSIVEGTRDVRRDGEDWMSQETRGKMKIGSRFKIMQLILWREIGMSDRVMSVFLRLCRASKFFTLCNVRESLPPRRDKFHPADCEWQRKSNLLARNMTDSK